MSSGRSKSDPGFSRTSRGTLLGWGATLLLLLVLGWWWYREVPGPAPIPPPEPTGDPYYDDIKHVTWLLQTRWSWLEMRQEQGLDLEALEAEALTLMKAEPGDRGFLRALQRYMSGLRDGHALAAMEGVDLTRERQWPFSLIEAEEGIMVDGINPATFQSKKLERGDLIVAINDESIEDVIRQQEAFVIASTPQSRRRQAIFDLTESTDLRTLKVKAVRNGEVEPVTFELPTAEHSDPVPRRSWRPYPEKFEEIDEGTAYLCVGSFESKDARFRGADPKERDEILDPQYAECARRFEKIASKSTLILDLRDNPGGTDLLGKALALHLMEPGFRYYGLQMQRRGRWPSVSWHSPEGIGHGAPRFEGRVICLISEETFSAADNLACCLRDQHPSVEFIGQPTGGASGAPRKFTLPKTNAVVRFCTMRVTAPNGEYVEGRGVTPDVLVRPTREQLFSGEDAALSVALERSRR